MNETADFGLREETDRWCRHAAEMLAADHADTLLALRAVREAVLLRRRWDLTAPEAPLRRQLLQLLPALQSVAQRQFADEVEAASARANELEQFVEEQIQDDDRYLVELLDRHSDRPAEVGFAIECFRDDLHWLGTQTAILDGARGVDFLGRVLLEQEALEREIDRWTNETNDPGRKKDTNDGLERSFFENLRPAAADLRTVALSRQIEALLERRLPTDSEGWYERWQSASRLAMRLGHGPVAEESEEPIPLSTIDSVHRCRVGAAQAWRDAVVNEPDRVPSLRNVARDLADQASESLTFLEDLPLPEAVRSLEILDEDLQQCERAVAACADDSLKNSRKRLRRRRGMLAGELQERRLAYRLESLFGTWFVAALERFILLLLVLFCVMLVVEEPLLRYEKAHWLTATTEAGSSADGQELAASTAVETVFAWLDLGICLVFLSEFTLKLALAQRRWLYFRRNWLTGLIPSIPLGFFAYAAHNLALAQRADWIVTLRALRYLRLPRMARWLRIARPVIRLLRLVGFMLRASDRLVRQMAPLLNRNLVLFERATIDLHQPDYRVRLSALRERFYYRAAETLHWLPPLAREQLARQRIDDLSAMLTAPVLDDGSLLNARSESNSREIPLESVVARLLSVTSAGISDRIGRTLANSVARWCRAFDLFAIRRLPFVRDLVAASRLPSPYDTTAVVANRIGMLLKQGVDRVHWLTDLYGTVTAPQLVDSIGEYMVRGAARPAKRLIVISVLFFLVSYLGHILPLPDGFAEGIQRLFALPLFILGGVCMIVLVVGIWFRQIAGQATEYFTRVAEAQFLSATTTLKSALCERQQPRFHDRVLAPELELTVENADGQAWPQTAEAAVARLWNDYLQGAPFHGNDTKTTTQLLGNLALLSLREDRLKYTGARRKQLERLDLDNARTLFRGPYVWFRFISRSLAQQTAKLVDNYNRYALPLDRAGSAEDWEVRCYVDWLRGRLGESRCGSEDGGDSVPLAEPFRRRLVQINDEPAASAGRRPPGQWFQGADFTAIHFLSDDRTLDADIRSRYGDTVADQLARDRCDNVRRVFQTYPWHRLPKQRRTFNPHAIYMRHFAGGRVLLLPLKFVVLILLWLYRLLSLFVRFVREVLQPSAGELAPLQDPDPFAVARRKIHRMRKPLFMECLQMRAEFDAEYLGIRLPTSTLQVREASRVQIEEDLELIGASPSIRREYRKMATETRRRVLDFCYWVERMGGETRSPESLRAMAIAYAIDYRGIRKSLEPAQRVRVAFDAALSSEEDSPGFRWTPAVMRAWLRNAGRCKRLFSTCHFSDLDSNAQAMCRRLVIATRGTLLKDVRRLTAGRIDAIEKAWKILDQIGRDPRPWSQQLVNLRAVQTLSVLDITLYCDLVAKLGEYEDAETSPIATESRS